MVRTTNIFDISRTAVRLPKWQSLAQDGRPVPVTSSFTIAIVSRLDLRSIALVSVNAVTIVMNRIGIPTHLGMVPWWNVVIMV